MNESHIIKSLNLTQGEVITMKMAKDRLEYEAFPLIDSISSRSDCTCKAGSYCPSYNICLAKSECWTDKPCIPVMN